MALAKLHLVPNLSSPSQGDHHQEGAGISYCRLPQQRCDIASKVAHIVNLIAHIRLVDPIHRPNVLTYELLSDTRDKGDENFLRTADAYRSDKTPIWRA